MSNPTEDAYVESLNNTNTSNTKNQETDKNFDFGGLAMGLDTIGDTMQTFGDVLDGRQGIADGFKAATGLMELGWLKTGDPALDREVGDDQQAGGHGAGTIAANFNEKWQGKAADAYTKQQSLVAQQTVQDQTAKAGSALADKAAMDEANARRKNIMEAISGAMDMASNIAAMAGGDGLALSEGLRHATEAIDQMGPMLGLSEEKAVALKKEMAKNVVSPAITTEARRDPEHARGILNFLREQGYALDPEEEERLLGEVGSAESVKQSDSLIAEGVAEGRTADEVYASLTERMQPGVGVPDRETFDNLWKLREKRHKAEEAATQREQNTRDWQAFDDAVLAQGGAGIQGGFDSEAIFHTVMRVSDPHTKAAMQGLIDADFRPKTDHSVYADIIMELDAGTDLGRYRHQLSPRRFRELQAYQQDLESPEFRGLRRKYGALNDVVERNAAMGDPLDATQQQRLSQLYSRALEANPDATGTELKDLLNGVVDAFENERATEALLKGTY